MNETGGNLTSSWHAYEMARAWAALQDPRTISQRRQLIGAVMFECVRVCFQKYDGAKFFQDRTRTVQHIQFGALDVDLDDVRRRAYSLGDERINPPISTAISRSATKSR